MFEDLGDGDSDLRIKLVGQTGDEERDVHKVVGSRR
jgi:hypothetical protein